MSSGRTYAHAYKGDKMRCGNCGTDMYEFIRDVLMGDRAEASMLKGINGYPDPVDGEVAECPNDCGNDNIIIHHEVVRCA